MREQKRAEWLPMTDYKALEQKIAGEKADKTENLEASRTKAKGEIVENFRKRAKPLSDFLLPELAALRSDMIGKYSVEIEENVTSETVRPNTEPWVRFEIVNDSTGERSGKIEVNIVRLPPKGGLSSEYGAKVSLIAGRNAEPLNLDTAFGMKRRHALDRDLAERIVAHAFRRVVRASS